MRHVNVRLMPVGIALVNAIGNACGFIGPMLIGYLRTTGLR